MSAVTTMQALVEIHKQEKPLEWASRSTSRSSPSFSSALPPSPASSIRSRSSSPPSSRLSPGNASPAPASAPRRPLSPCSSDPWPPVSQVVAPLPTTFTSPARLPSPPPSIRSSCSSSSSSSLPSPAFPSQSSPPSSDPSDLPTKDGASEPLPAPSFSQQPLEFTFLSPLFYNQKMQAWHTIKDVYRSLARTVDRHPFALLTVQYSVALVHGMTIYLLSVLLSLAHLLVIAATMEKRLGWRSGLKRLGALDYESNVSLHEEEKEARARLGHRSRHRSARSDRALAASSGWDAALRHRLTRWNQWAVPSIWDSASSTEQQSKENDTHTGGDEDTTTRSPQPLTRWTEGVDYTVDESYPSRLRKAFVKTLSGGFQQTALSTNTGASTHTIHHKTTAMTAASSSSSPSTTRKKVTFSEQVIIWGRRRSSFGMSGPLLSPFSKGQSEEGLTVKGSENAPTPTSTPRMVSEAASENWSSSLSAHSMTVETVHSSSSVGVVERLSTAQQTLHQQQLLEVGSKIPNSFLCHQDQHQNIPSSSSSNNNDNRTDHVTACEEAYIQQQVEKDANGSNISLLVLPAASSSSSSSSVVTAPQSDLSAAPIAATPNTTATTNPATCTAVPRKAVSASNLSSSYVAHAYQQQKQQAVEASRHDLRRAVSVPVIQVSPSPAQYQQRQGEQQQQDDGDEEGNLARMASMAHQIPRPDSRGSATSVQSMATTSSSTSTLPVVTPSRSVDFVLPERPSKAAPPPPATAEAPAAASTTTSSGRRISLSLGTRARRSLSFVLPGQSQHAYNIKQPPPSLSHPQQQSRTGTMSSISSTSSTTTVTSQLGVERQSSLKRSNLMYRIVHPQRYKRELALEQEAQDRERLRFLVRLQHHQLMNEGQNGFPACPETLKWMLQIEGRTKQFQQQSQEQADREMLDGSGVVEDGVIQDGGKKTKKTKKSTKKGTKKERVGDEQAMGDADASLHQDSQRGMQKKASSSSLVSSSSKSSSVISTPSSSSSSLLLPSLAMPGSMPLPPSSRPSEVADPFLHPEYDYTFPLSAEWVTGLGAPDSMISTSVGTQFPPELQHPKHSHHASSLSSSSSSSSKRHSSFHPNPVLFDEVKMPGSETGAAQNSSDSAMAPPSSHGFHLFRKHPSTKQASSSSASSSLQSTPASTPTHNTFPRRVQQLFHPSHPQPQPQSGFSLLDQSWIHPTNRRASIEVLPMAVAADPPQQPSLDSRKNGGGARMAVYDDDNPCHRASVPPKVEDQTSFAAFGFPAAAGAKDATTATTVAAKTVSTEAGLMTESTASLASFSSSSTSSSSKSMSEAGHSQKRTGLAQAMLRPLRRSSSNSSSLSSSSADLGQSKPQTQPQPPMQPQPKQKQKATSRIWPSRRQATVAAEGQSCGGAGEVEVLADESVLDELSVQQEDDSSRRSSCIEGSASSSSTSLDMSSSPRVSAGVPQRKMSVGKVLIQKLTPRKKQSGSQV
ncbi:hypothetical protein BGZ73_002882 [Actinomortierella ambigua]|nr:hypothetical protein BGZ73_002882 [Actinomortierella ambigua]